MDNQTKENFILILFFFYLFLSFQFSFLTFSLGFFFHFPNHDNRKYDTKCISMCTSFLFLVRVMKIFFFLVIVFFSKSGFLIMSYGDKGETDGGLIAETSKNQ